MAPVVRGVVKKPIRLIVLVLLLIVDITVINYFLNQLFYSWESVYLLGLCKSLGLAYISFKLRLINLLNVLLLFI